MAPSRASASGAAPALAGLEELQRAGAALALGAGAQPGAGAAIFASSLPAIR